MSIHYFDDDIPICRWCGAVSKPGKTLKYLPWCGKKCNNRPRVALTLRCAKAIYAIRQGCTMSMAAAFSGLSRERVRVISSGIIRPTASRVGRALATVRKILSSIKDIGKYKLSNAEIARIISRQMVYAGFKAGSEKTIEKKVLKELKGKRKHIRHQPHPVDYANALLPTRVLSMIWSPLRWIVNRKVKGLPIIESPGHYLIKKEMEMKDRYEADMASYFKEKKEELARLVTEVTKGIEEAKKTHWV